MGTRIVSTSGPVARARKNATVWSENWPVAAPSTSAWLICGLWFPVCGPAGLTSPGEDGALAGGAEDRCPSPA